MEKIWINPDGIKPTTLHNFNMLFRHIVSFNAIYKSFSSS